MAPIQFRNTLLANCHEIDCLFGDESQKSKFLQINFKWTILVDGLETKGEAASGIQDLFDHGQLGN